MVNHPNRSRKKLPAHLVKENPTPADYQFLETHGRFEVIKESLGAMAETLRYPELAFILFRKGGGGTRLAMCRGQSKSCNVIAKERQKLGPCADCVMLNNERTTVGELYDRMQKGDA